MARLITLIATVGSSAPLIAAAGGINPATSPGRTPDLLEHVVDALLERCGLENSGNTLTHWGIFAGLFIASWFLRNVVTTGIFKILKHFASKTETTLDDKLFPALENPTKGLIVVLGSFTAFKVLKLSPVLDAGIVNLFKIAFPAVIFWGVTKAISAIVDHLGEVAREKDMGLAAFLPLIKKTVIIVFIILAGLTIIQSFGYDVKTFLAGLGIGGLAFALAAQDTLSNLFGSFVVAIDRPFHVGDAVQIGAHQGTVEGIGMRSTKLRTPARTLIAIPNKTVASDAIINFTRMPQRRVEQTIGLTYNTTPERMDAVLADIRAILKNDPEVHQEAVFVNFINYGPSSLDIQIVYFASNPDWTKHLELRERINLKIMRAVAARGLSFAFPTQTIQFDGAVARAMADRKA
ncbi:MAG: mechanosensitive ion channel family protein [Opitutaceae bacterium]